MRKATHSEKLGNAIMMLLIGLFSLACIIPFLLVFSISITDNATLIREGYRLIPRHFSWSAYEVLLRDPTLMVSSYRVTTIVTVCGTCLSLLVNAMLAYPLSRKDFRFRNVYAFALFFTMLFNGGLVPWYMLCTSIGLKDNYFALIIPGLAAVYYVFILRNNFQAIPDSFHESAKIDGASEYRIFFQIILPLSKPAIATIALFVTLGYWNDWFTGLMLIDKNKIVPLQLRLITLLNNIEFLSKNSKVNILPQDYPSQALRMATCMVVVGPIIFAYPFFQKHIIKGLMIGGVKG